MSRIIPHENDVLLGRGGRNHNHVGNEKLRRLAQAHAHRYLHSRRSNKGHIISECVFYVSSADPPGRFLKWNKATKEWEEVIDSNVAKEKISQVLRDCTQVLLRNGKKNTIGSKKKGLQEIRSVSTQQEHYLQPFEVQTQHLLPPTGRISSSPHDAICSAYVAHISTHDQGKNHCAERKLPCIISSTPAQASSKIPFYTHMMVRDPPVASITVVEDEMPPEDQLWDQFSNASSPRQAVIVDNPPNIAEDDLCPKIPTMFCNAYTTHYTHYDNSERMITKKDDLNYEQHSMIPQSNCYVQLSRDKNDIGSRLTQHESHKFQLDYYEDKEPFLNLNLSVSDLLLMKEWSKRWLASPIC